MAEKIILDCDPGYDDAVALLLAQGSPKIELAAVTTVAGNQTIEKVTANARKIAAVAGIKGIPFAAGAQRPLLRDNVVVCPEIHGESGLDGPNMPEAEIPLVEGHAARLIVDLVMSNPPKTITLVPTGPLTNIALAVRLEPRIVERVKEVVLMGGGCRIGNVRPMAEFNIENDPEAAKIVFDEKWKVVMVGLDLTYQARADKAIRERAAKINTKAGRFLYETLEAFADKYRAKTGRDDPPVHDPCAVAYVVDPDVVKAVQVPIRIETRGELTAGMTVADFRRKAPQDCHTYAALELDAPKFWDMLFEAVENLKD